MTEEIVTNKWNKAKDILGISTSTNPSDKKKIALISIEIVVILFSFIIHLKNILP